MRPPHNRTKFILLHQVVVLVFGGLLAIGVGSPFPPFLLALAPLLGLLEAQPRDKWTYWISVGVALLIVCAAAVGIFYLALTRFARGRW